MGDIADALFRANTRNAVVLEKYLREKGAKALNAQGHPAPTLDPSDPDEYDRILIEENGPPPSYTSTSPTRQGAQLQTDANGRNTQQSIPERRRDGGIFGLGSKKKQPDVEHGTGQKSSEPAAILPGGNKSTTQNSSRS